MKQILAILLALLIALPLTGCETRAARAASASQSEPESQSESEPEPESEPEEEEPPEESGPDTTEVIQAVEEMFAALASGDPDRIHSQVGSENFPLTQPDGSFNESVLALLKQLTYEVTEAQISSEDSASVTVALTNTNMEAIFADYLRRSAELEYNNNTSDSPLPQDELDEEYHALFLEMIRGSGTASTTVIIRMERSGGRWRAQVSDALRDAAVGGYFSARERTGINAGGGVS